MIIIIKILLLSLYSLTQPYNLRTAVNVEPLANFNQRTSLNQRIMQKEIFKDIKGYENMYQVSNLGNVKSLKRKTNNGRGIRSVKERMLKAKHNIRGYYDIVLCKNGKTKSREIHQLVAIMFLGHNPNKGVIVIDHKDHNKLNNNVNNLQIITHRENITKDKFRKNYSSKYVGVSLLKNKWVARININSKPQYLGLFNNEIDAHLAYQNALKNI